MVGTRYLLLIVALFLGVVACLAQSVPGSSAISVSKSVALKEPKDTSIVKLVNVPDSIYTKRLAALPFELKLTFNPIVKRYIEFYTKTLKKSLRTVLGLSNFYFPIMDEVLRGDGLPAELKYITIIESALNPLAISPAHAVGLWQFMKGTGKENGLTINNVVDERRGIYESTKAAGAYLKKLFDIYKDWTLALAAYNCGPGAVNKAIQRSGGQHDFWGIYAFLPRETREYVPKYMGAAYAFNYFKEHDIEPIPAVFLTQVDTVMIDKGLHLGQVSSVLGINLELLKQLNPQYLKNYVPGNGEKTYALNVPLGQKSKFAELKDSIYAYRSSFYTGQSKKVTATSGTVTHQVRSGESLWEIAKRYHVSVNNLRAWNNLSGTKLAIGQKISVNQP